MKKQRLLLKSMLEKRVSKLSMTEESLADDFLTDSNTDTFFFDDEENNDADDVTMHPEMSYAKETFLI